jgi:uncharacterized protein YuzE
MSVMIANRSFDCVDYDEVADVLYLRVLGSDPEAVTDATPEGHAISWDEAGRVIGLTIVNAKWLLDRDGEITLTERIPASTLAPAFTSP